MLQLISEMLACVLFVKDVKFDFEKKLESIKILPLQCQKEFEIVALKIFKMFLKF
jgi:hypothetical protein